MIALIIAFIFAVPFGAASAEPLPAAVGRPLDYYDSTYYSGYEVIPDDDDQVTADLAPFIPSPEEQEEEEEGSGEKVTDGAEDVLSRLLGLFNLTKRQTKNAVSGSLFKSNLAV